MAEDIKRRLCEKTLQPISQVGQQWQPGDIRRILRGLPVLPSRKLYRGTHLYLKEYKIKKTKSNRILSQAIILYSEYLIF
jgi:predicted secreted protein